MQAETPIPLPEIDELLNVPNEADVFEHFTAALVATASLLIGFAGNLLFYAKPIGINAFIYVIVSLLASFGLLIYLRRSIVRKHAIFAFPAVIFALLLSVRSAPQLMMFNLAAMLGSLLIVVHFTGTSRFIGGHWFKPIRRTIETVMIGWILSLSAIIPDSLRWFSRTELNNQQLATIRSVVRGILITLPVVAMFTILLSSADAVFGKVAEQALSLLLPENASSLFQQLVLIIIFAIISVTMFWIMLTNEDSAEASFQEKPHHFRLNIIETSTVLSSVNFLFIVFVIIQARYFFGGEANINIQGYTYAEYARRGFYELLAVSCMTMVLLVTLESLTYRKRVEENTFRGLVILLVALTFVIFIAAFQRLNLYENAYGYTRIRVMSGTFMIWLVVLLGVLLVAILRHHSELFWVGCIVTGLGFVLTLNLMNMDGFIANRNIARFEDTGKLDVSYLLLLSDDAIPAVSSLLDNENLSTYDQDILYRGLATELYGLDQEHQTRGLFGYHIGKNRARQALDEHRELLQPYLYAR